MIYWLFSNEGAESPHVIAEFYVNLNKFKIIGLFSIIHVAMAMIEILRLTQ